MPSFSGLSTLPEARMRFRVLGSVRSMWGGMVEEDLLVTERDKALVGMKQPATCKDHKSFKLYV